MIEENSELIKKYKRLALLLNEAREILFSDSFILSHRKVPKKSPYYINWMKVTDAIDKARDKGEELMFIDCPEDASVYIFYPYKDDDKK